MASTPTILSSFGADEIDDVEEDGDDCDCENLDEHEEVPEKENEKEEDNEEVPEKDNEACPEDFRCCLPRYRGHR